MTSRERFLHTVRFEPVDVPFVKGAVGVGTFNCGASFDNFEVTGEGIPGAVSQEGKLAKY